MLQVQKFSEVLYPLKNTVQYYKVWLVRYKTLHC